MKQVYTQVYIFIFSKCTSSKNTVRHGRIDQEKELMGSGMSSIMPAGLHKIGIACLQEKRFATSARTHVRDDSLKLSRPMGIFKSVRVHPLQYRG